MKLVFESQLLAELLFDFCKELAGNGEYSTFSSGVYTTCNGDHILTLDGGEVAWNGHRTQLSDHPVGRRLKELAPALQIEPVKMESSLPGLDWRFTSAEWIDHLSSGKSTGWSGSEEAKRLGISERDLAIKIGSRLAFAKAYLGIREGDVSAALAR
jgi:hypothetical protein